MGSYLKKIFEAVAIGALGRGLLYWAESRGWPIEKWVASAIDNVVGSSISPEAIAWILAGGFGILGMFFWEYWLTRRQKVEPDGTALPQTDPSSYPAASPTWKGMPEYTLWEAACLLEGIEPLKERARDGGPANAWRTKLVRAMQTGGLRVVKEFGRGGQIPMPDQSQVKPEMLIEYLNEINEPIPKWLEIKNETPVVNMPIAARVEPGLISLHDAVLNGWERIRVLPFLQEPSVTEHRSLLEYYEADPKKLASIAAQIIFNHADPRIPIEGRYPPRNAREWIPQDIASEMAFNDDATVMFNWFDQDKAMDERRRYVDLKVRSADIDRRIRQLQE